MGRKQRAIGPEMIKGTPPVFLSRGETVVRFPNHQEIRGRESQVRISMKKKKRKSSTASLKNLVPGGNLQHGAFRFLRTGEIPAEHADIAAEAKQFEQDLNREYCRSGNTILNIVQAVPIRQLVSNFVFSELLITHLWQQVSRAGPDGIVAVMASSAFTDWLAAGNRMNRRFRQLRRNLKDFNGG